MNTTTPSSPFEPLQDSGNDAEEQQRTSTQAGIFAALVAMLPWPLIAIGFSWSGGLLEEASDSALMFGGITLIFLLPLGSSIRPNGSLQLYSLAYAVLRSSYLHFLPPARDLERDISFSFSCYRQASRLRRLDSGC